MKDKSYQNNAEFYKMMLQMQEDAKKSKDKIVQTSDDEKLLRLREEIYKTQKLAQKELEQEKENEKESQKKKQEEERKYLEQLRKFKS